MQKVKRSCNADKIIKTGEMSRDDVLRASWDYFERKGYRNPEKIISDRIKPLMPMPRAGD